MQEKPLLQNIKMIETVKVVKVNELRKFIDLPHDIYKGDDNYVPELFMEQKKLFDKKKNPFFSHSSAEFFLAYKDGLPVGRIAAIRNNNYLDFQGTKEGFFGFFDCIDDQDVANALLNTACQWVKAQGLEKITGPENYTVNESCGILTEGFDRPPVIGMPYNKPYYRKLLEGFDMQTAMKLTAYQINSGEMARQAVKGKNIFKYRLAKQGITIRPFNMKDFNAEVDKFHKIYNDSFSENWGFVPLTLEEFRYQATGLKSVADPDLVLFAEKEKELIGFITTLPDYNQVFKQLKRGRLLPFGWLKILRAKKYIDRVRISIMGIKKEYRKSGVGAIFYARIFEQAKRKKLFYGEGSYVMENNEVMQKSIEFLGGNIYKRYRIYEKSLI